MYPWNGRFVGFVKSTNKYNVDIEPMKTVTFSGLVQKIKNADSAVTENTETATSRLGVCPRVVAIDKSRIISTSSCSSFQHVSKDNNSDIANSSV